MGLPAHLDPKDIIMGSMKSPPFQLGVFAYIELEFFQEETPLHKFAYSGNLEVVKVLMDDIDVIFFISQFISFFICNIVI